MNHPEFPELMVIEPSLVDLTYCDICLESEIHDTSWFAVNNPGEQDPPVTSTGNLRTMYMSPDDLKVCEKCVREGRYEELE